MEVRTTMDKQPPQVIPPNIELEIAITKIARALFDFVSSQDDSVIIKSVDRLLGDLQSRANDYNNQTGRLHPDLGFELREWALFKSELLSPEHEDRVRTGKSSLTPESVEDYGITPEKIISTLEEELGIKY